MVFVQHGDLFLKCDCCGLKVLVYKDETDRCLVHDYIHDNNWITRKINGKWINLCEDCARDYLKAKREKWIKEATK